MTEEQAAYEVEPEQVETEAPIEEQVETEEPEDTGEPQADAEPEPELEHKQVPLAALEAERRKRQQLEAKLEWLAEQQQQRDEPQRPPQPQAPMGEPRIEDFDSYDSYQAAVRQYDRQQVLAEFQQLQQQQQVYARQREALESFQGRAAKTEGKPDDYQERIKYAFSDPSLPFTAPIAEVVLTDEAGPDLVYHLSTHPDELRRLAKLSPVQQAVEAGKLAARLSVKPVSVSAAPPPVKPVRSANATATVNPDDMSPDQWRKWRLKQLASRGK
jgi:hypothetical protein